LQTVFFPSLLTSQMKKLRIPAAFAQSAVILATAFSSMAMAQNLAIVNGKPVPSSRMQAMERQLAATGQTVDDTIRTQLKQEIINREVLLQAAEARGLQKTQAFADQMELARQSVLIRALFTDIESETPVDEAAIKAEYDRIANSPEATEYRASHILVATEEQANDLTAKLAAGADFAAMAKEFSTDPGSGAQGGDLNFASANSYVPEFSKAMVDLTVGQTTKAPVKSQFGWHIIRLTDKRKRELPPLAEVQEAIGKQLRENILSRAQNDLLNKAKIE
jgi:peptidyl-prolyl cis-trans isomerase C